jgi:thymidylate synthase ThyX
LEHKPTYFVEEFSEAERFILNRYFTNLDKPVFCLINLPEVVKGALYARYSRTSKSTRRLFLDEFVNRREIAINAMSRRLTYAESEARWEQNPAAAFEFIAEELKTEGSDPIFSLEHAESLYRRVFDEYGDDSVSQLGGVHIVFEQASNVVINEIEWGRLGAYLEQSTRYIDYSLKLADGRYRYYLPEDIMGSKYAELYVENMDKLFELYVKMLDCAIRYFEKLNPRESFDGDDRAYRTSIRAKAFDAVRPMLPAGVVSNVGFFGSAQAAANMLRRLLSSELAEAREVGRLALQELRHPDAAPAFFNQIDDPAKGIAWLDYFRSTRSNTASVVGSITGRLDKSDTFESPAKNEVTLAWSDPDNQQKVCAGIIYELNSDNLSMDDCMSLADGLGADNCQQLITSYCGQRGKLNSTVGNRRWKPGRAFELAHYNFDMVIDFGIMRDWKRHRLLTAMWGKLDTSLGWTVSPFIEEMDVDGHYAQAMALSAKSFGLLAGRYPNSAQYAVCLAYRMRFMININARALMFMLELRTSQQGHPSYREVGQQMHRLVAEVDPAIAASMGYVDYNEYSLERAEAEKRLSQKRSGQSPQ